MQDKSHSMHECGDNIQTEIANILRHKLCCVSRNILRTWKACFWSWRLLLGNSSTNKVWTEEWNTDSKLPANANFTCNQVLTTVAALRAKVCEMLCTSKMVMRCRNKTWLIFSCCKFSVVVSVQCLQWDGLSNLKLWNYSWDKPDYINEYFLYFSVSVQVRFHRCYHRWQCIVLLNLESTDTEPFCQKQHFTKLAFSMPYHCSTV